MLTVGLRDLTAHRRSLFALLSRTAQSGAIEIQARSNWVQLLASPEDPHVVLAIHSDAAPTVKEKVERLVNDLTKEIKTEGTADEHHFVALSAFLDANPRHHIQL